MAITKSDILAAVNDMLGRAETNIDRQIKEIVKDLGGRGRFLPATATITTQAAKRDYSTPTLFREIEDIKIGNDSLEKGLMSQWSDGAAQPENYLIWNEKIWFDPVPDGVYTVTVNYFKDHADTADAIEFSDQYRTAIYEGSAYALARDKQLYDDAKVHKDLYEAEILQLLNRVRSRPRFTRYRDV